MTIYHVIGIMSGTSLDGLDIAYCTFEKGKNGAWKYRIDAADCIPYDHDLSIRLADAPKLNGLDLLAFHQEFGAFVGNQVKMFVKTLGQWPGLVASHGHTVFHNPTKKISFQLGDGAAIYAGSGIPTVCDFRSVDVNLGGQGAPLVPVGDALLFTEYELCLNLGGIANISYDYDGRRIAFDICGCNLLLNALAMEKGQPYDPGGAWAREGKVNATLLQQLNDWKYLLTEPPKSLDKETMISELMPILQKTDISIEDKLATVTEHIALQIAAAAKGRTGNMMITGGGAFNAFLVEKISEKCQVHCMVPDDKLVQYKEALIFAFLGLMRVLGERNALASVTGAKSDSIGGALYGYIPLKFLGISSPKNNWILVFLLIIFVQAAVAVVWILRSRWSHYGF